MPGSARTLAAGEAPEHALALGGGDPGAVVVDEQQRGAASPSRSETRTWPPGRPCRAAFSSRLSSSIRRLSVSPLTHRPVRRRVEARLDLGVPAPQVEDRRVGELGEVDGLGARGRPASPRASA